MAEKMAFGLALIAAVTVGYFFTGYPFYWERKLFIDWLAWMAACSLVAWVLRRWQPLWASVLSCGLIFLYLLLGVGPAASLAVIFFLASAPCSWPHWAEIASRP
jgi:hypothetical protein